MFAYFRTHRRAGSNSNNTPQSPNNLVTTPQKLPSSPVTLIPEISPRVPSQSPRTSIPASPALRSSPVSTFPTPFRYYAVKGAPEEPQQIQHTLQEQALSSPVSRLPPVLPPIPSVTEGDAEKEQTLKNSALRDGVSPTVPHSASRSRPLSINPLRLHAVVSEDENVVERPMIVSNSLSPIPEPASPQEQEEAAAIPRQGPAQPSKEEPQPRPISLAYRLDFGHDFTINDDSPIGQGISGFFSNQSPLAPSPSSPLTDAIHPSKPPIVDRDLEPPTMPVTDQNSSPSSYSSSYQKSASSTTLAADFPPASSAPSRTAQVVATFTPVTTKVSKPKRSLLNPVSLLMRRRTSHNLESLTDNSQIGRIVDSATSLPEDYDPRIKGKGVHDFNAPRPRRNFSTNDLEVTNSLYVGKACPVDEYRRRKSLPWTQPDDESLESGTRREKSPERSHTPVFIEHFEENNPPETSAVNREALANQSFLARISNKLDLKAFEDSPILLETGRLAASAQRDDENSSPVPSFRISSDEGQEKPINALDTNTSQSPKILTSNLSPNSPPLDSQFQLLTPREHRTSNASRSSRFSFQLASDHSAAQEHELEERHKQKAAEKAGGVLNDDGSDDSDDDDDDEDDDQSDFDADDGGFEEPVPGVNADAEDMSAGLTRGKHLLKIDTLLGERSSSSEFQRENYHQPHPPPNVAEGHRFPPFVNESQNPNDDMYFDDGFIEEPLPHERHQRFDESFFDDPAVMQQRGKLFVEPLHSVDTIKIINASQKFADDISDEKIPSAPIRRELVELHFGDLHDTVNGRLEPNAGDNPHTTGRLDAYHSALASAATKAEADGKFERGGGESYQDPHNTLDDEANPEQASWEDAVARDECDPHSVRDDGAVTPTRWPSYFDGMGANGSNKGPVDEDYGSDDLDDDPMIAAANAEALAADDSGFYGREFNFYGNSNSGTEVYNGGFFGSPTKEGIGRSTSLREPTLTPITERSEFSRAPSYMSLSPFGPAMNGNSMLPPLPSPGLKELAARFGLNHDDLTLKQLMRLRKETLGSSAAGSAGSSPTNYTTSSPLVLRNSAPAPPLVSECVEEEVSSVSSSDDEQDKYGKTWDRSDMPSPSPTSPNLSFGRKYPVTNAKPETRESYFAHSRHASAGATFNTTSTPPDHVAASPVMSSPISPMPVPSPQLMQKFAARPPASSATYAERQAQHRRSTSAASATGADSVAYVREHDRWFLERRRTLGTGEVLVLGRELVEGGTI